MFDKLKELYIAYTTAKLTKPYSGIATQGHGMAFCDEWKARLPDLCNHFSMKAEDMDYLKYPTYMPLLMRHD